MHNRLSRPPIRAVQSACRVPGHNVASLHSTSGAWGRLQILHVGQPGCHEETGCSPSHGQSNPARRFGPELRGCTDACVCPSTPPSPRGFARLLYYRMIPNTTRQVPSEAAPVKKNSAATAPRHSFLAREAHVSRLGCSSVTVLCFWPPSFELSETQQ